MATWQVSTAGAALEFDTTIMAWPTRPIAVDTNHFFIAYGGAAADGFAEVLVVNTSTWAVTTAAARLEHDTQNATFNSAVQIDTNHFVNFYLGSTTTTDGFAQTFTVNTTTWAVTTAAARFLFDTDVGSYNSAVLIDANHVINFWAGAGADGFAQVFTVNTTTWAVTTAAAALEFDTVLGQYHSAVAIDTNHFINFWCGNGSDGFAQVFTVNTTTWAVTTAAASLEFDTQQAQLNGSFKIDTNHFINFWSDVAADGIAQVFTVNTTTWAVTTASALLEFDTQDFQTNSQYSVTQVDANHFLHVWAGPDTGAVAAYDGFAQIFEVNTTTWAVTTAAAPFEFDATQGEYNAISALIAGTDNKFLNLWSGSGDDGFAQVLSVELPVADDIVSHTSAAIAGVADVSVTFPSSYTPLEDDLILIFPSSQSTVALASTPSGWVNPLGSTVGVNADAFGASVGYHWVTAGEESGVTLTYTATNWFSGVETGEVHAVAVRGVDTTTPIDDINTTFDDSDTATPHLTAALTGANLDTGSLVISNVTKDSVGYYGAEPTGWSDLLRSSTNQAKWTGYRDALTTASTNVDAGSTTPSSGDEYISITVALKLLGAGDDHTLPSIDSTLSLSMDNTTITQNHIIAVQDIALALTEDDTSILLMTTDTYYFNASDGGPSDPNSAWTNDANGFDSSNTTIADGSSVGNVSTNYLKADGTTAPGSGGTITQVRARIYGRFNAEAEISAAIYTDSLGELLGTAVVDETTGTGGSWGAYTTLGAPSGGWDWAGVQALEVKVYVSDVVFGSRGFGMVEIEVTSAIEEAVELTVQDIALALTEDNATISQNHVVVVQDTTLALTEDNTTITQNHVIPVADIALSLTEDNTTVAETNFVIASQDIALALTEDNATIIQNHVVPVDDVVLSLTEDATTITQVHTIPVDDIALALTTDNTTVEDEGGGGDDHDLEVQDIALSLSTDNTTIAQNHILPVQDILLSTSTDNMTVTETNFVLTVQDLALALTTDDTTITQTNFVLTVQDIALGLATDETSITQNHTLVPQDIALSLLEDNLTITQVHVITPQDIDLALTTDNTTLAQNHVLTAQDIALALRIDPVQLEGGEIIRKYYIDSNGNIYWIISESIGLVEKI